MSVTRTFLIFKAWNRSAEGNAFSLPFKVFKLCFKFMIACESLETGFPSFLGKILSKETDLSTQGQDKGIKNKEPLVNSKTGKVANLRLYSCG
jgi:hypothetical protein